MANKSLWNKDKLSKIDNLQEYMKEIFNIKDLLENLKADQRKKAKAYNLAKGKTDFQENKLKQAYEGLEKFRK